jgi:D-alanyl-D-alanine carboxypeptidase
MKIFQHHKIKFLLLTALTIGMAFPAIHAQAIKPPDEKALRQKLQAKLDEWHKAGKFAGATLGVCPADGNCFALSVVFTDLEKKTPMRPTDLMAAGSVGKTYAAAVALQLVKEGKINLDDKVEKYLGKESWFSRLPNAKDITVRQLMNHTSGLVRYEFKEQFTKDLTANPDKIWLPEELVAYLLDEKAPFEAGKGWDYSDTNYIVLGMIIERVTGKKFYDEARRRVLKPLKFERTFPQDRRELKGLIPGYAGADNPFGGKDKVLENGKFIINPQFEWTGGGWISNAEDLARWAKLMYEGKAFDASLLPQMLDGVPARLGRDAKYGLGVIIRPTAAGLTYGHSGFFPGYMTDMMYFPEHKISLAVQVNTSVPQNLGKSLGRVLVEAAEVLINQNKDNRADTIEIKLSGEKILKQISK